MSDELNAPEQPVDNEQADTREKLEADVQKYLDLPYDCHNWTDFGAVIKWLDRQAAITTSELCGDYTYMKADRDLKAREAQELQTKVDKLTAERDDLQNITEELKKRNGELLEGRAHWIDQAISIYEHLYLHDRGAIPVDVCSIVIAKIDELTAERDYLQKVVRIQSESFRKLERELKEAKDAIRGSHDNDKPGDEKAKG